MGLNYASKLSAEKDEKLSEDIEKLDEMTKKGAAMLQAFDALVQAKKVDDDSLDDLQRKIEEENWNDTEKKMLAKSIQTVKDARAEAEKYRQDPSALLKELGINISGFGNVEVFFPTHLPGVIEIQVANSADLSAFTKKFEGALSEIFREIGLAGDNREAQWFGAKYYNPQWLGLEKSRLLGIIVTRADATNNEKEHDADVRHEYSHACIERIVRPVLHHYFTGIKPDSSATELRKTTEKMSEQTRVKLESALGDISFLGAEGVRPAMANLLKWKSLQDEQNLLDELRAYSFNLGLLPPTTQMTRLAFREPLDEDDGDAIDSKLAERFFHVHVLRVKAGIMSPAKKDEALATIGVSQSLSQAKRLLENVTRNWEISSENQLRRVFECLTVIWKYKEKLLQYRLGEKVLIDMEKALETVIPPREVLDRAIGEFFGNLPAEYREIHKNLYPET